MNTTNKRQMNTKLYNLATNVYFDAIPLDKIVSILTEGNVEMVDEAGNAWEGLLLGENSYTTFALREYGKILRVVLYLSWYRMLSGRYEIVCYIS